MENCSQLSSHMHISQMSPYHFYNQYHTHPVNKFFHLIGIPCILLSSLLLLKQFYIVYNKPLLGLEAGKIGLGLNYI